MDNILAEIYQCILHLQTFQNAQQHNKMQYVIH